VIDSEPNSYLIENIFFNKAPLHDGALIIRGNRLYSAGCLLPLSENLDITRKLGTRHRAAIGLSENSDAVIIVVSEETGNISIAFEGKLTRDYTEKTLREALIGYLAPGSKKSKTSSSKAKKTDKEGV
ncbi:MAG: DNA integrity scanning protein DisA nucleotide-binding domain protein, partial [Clostridia bacterium]|nr:DNA integrity scanning protein DisA nucleotide-binding domain protein [Clostridia bacterium]